VREFWLRLVTDFEQLEPCRGLQDKISDIEQRMSVLDETRSVLLLEVETERDRARQYMDKLEDKSEEVEKLRMALRDANDEKEHERELQQCLVARFRASVCPTPGFGGVLIDRVT
jgi:chromosome segregation ATPase